MLPLSRPTERSGEDVDIILTRLKNVKAFERFNPNLLQEICLCGFYECLEKGITCRLQTSSTKKHERKRGHGLLPYCNNKMSVVHFHIEFSAVSAQNNSISPRAVTSC